MPEQQLAKKIADQLAQFQVQLQSGIEKQIAESIEKNVNGKIRNLDKKIEDYIHEDIAWKEKDALWKQTAQPTVDLGTNAIGFWKVSKWISLVLVTIASTVAAVKIFFK